MGKRLPENFTIAISLAYFQGEQVSLVPLNALKKKKEQLSHWIHRKWYVSLLGGKKVEISFFVEEQI